MWDSTNPIPRGQNSNWIRTDVSVEGRLIATYDTAGGTYFAIAAGGADIDIGLHLHVTDALGTRRLQTDPWGWPEEACASGPFGDNLNCSTLANAPPSADAATPKSAASFEVAKSRSHHPQTERRLGPRLLRMTPVMMGWI